MRRLAWLALAVFAFGVLLMGCSGNDASTTVTPPGGGDPGGGGTDPGGGGGTPTTTVIDVLRADSDFSTFVSLLDAAGLSDELATGGPYTVFAPTNAAFAKVPPATLEALQQDTAALRRVLLYHIAQPAYTTEQLRGMTSVPTLLGPSLTVRADCPSGALYVDSARIIGPDQQASNGIIQVIDSVLQPPPA